MTWDGDPLDDLTLLKPNQTHGDLKIKTYSIESM